MHLQRKIVAAIVFMVLLIAGFAIASQPKAATPPQALGTTTVIEHPDDMANYLCKTCEGSAEDGIFCLGYIRGAINAIDGETQNGKEPPVYCMAPQTTLNDIKLVFVRYCDNHPKDLKFRASSVLAVALAHEFPCTKEGGGSAQ